MTGVQTCALPILGVLCKLDVERVYDHVSWDFFNVYASALWVFREIEKIDNVLDFNCQIFHYAQC